MQRLSQTSERENAGTTSLGALLRAKLDNQTSKSSDALEGAGPSRTARVRTLDAARRPRHDPFAISSTSWPSASAS